MGDPGRRVMRSDVNFVVAGRRLMILSSDACPVRAGAALGVARLPSTEDPGGQKWRRIWPPSVGYRIIP